MVVAFLHSKSEPHKNPKCERGHFMSTTTKTIKTAEEKVALKDAKILQLQNEKKKIIQQQKTKERKERTSRFCRRHGLLENRMPDLASFTEEQFAEFVHKGIDTEYGRKILTQIKTQNP